MQEFDNWCVYVKNGTVQVVGHLVGDKRLFMTSPIRNVINGHVVTTFSNKTYTLNGNLQWNLISDRSVSKLVMKYFTKRGFPKNWEDIVKQPSAIQLSDIILTKSKQPEASLEKIRVARSPIQTRSKTKTSRFAASSIVQVSPSVQEETYLDSSDERSLFEKSSADFCKPSISHLNGFENKNEKMISNHECIAKEAIVTMPSSKSKKRSARKPIKDKVKSQINSSEKSSSNDKKMTQKFYVEKAPSEILTSQKFKQIKTAASLNKKPEASKKQQKKEKSFVSSVKSKDKKVSVKKLVTASVGTLKHVKEVRELEEAVAAKSGHSSQDFFEGNHIEQIGHAASSDYLCSEVSDRLCDNILTPLRKQADNSFSWTDESILDSSMQYMETPKHLKRKANGEITSSTQKAADRATKKYMQDRTKLKSRKGRNVSDFASNLASTPSKKTEPNLSRNLFDSFELKENNDSSDEDDYFSDAKDESKSQHSSQFFL